jgi:hypothetical protein
VPEKISFTQALGINSGFLTPFGMTAKCIFPQIVKQGAAKAGPYKFDGDGNTFHGDGDTI